MGLVIRVLVNAAAIVLAAHVVPGLAVRSLTTALVAGLVLVGILSSSALIGILHRSTATGAKVFIYQGGGIAGIAAGIGVAWVVRWAMDKPWDGAQTTSVGAMSGLAAGLILAAMSVFVLSAAYRFLHAKYAELNRTSASKAGTAFSKRFT